MLIWNTKNMQSDVWTKYVNTNKFSKLGVYLKFVSLPGGESTSIIGERVESETFFFVGVSTTPVGSGRRAATTG